ncbi:hypothetical protein [Lacinutrix sp.]|nr:hypothetical protein [Lacinutrix sp.]MDG1715906.1 hypothetical protein [Lacinutrix sp.]
MRSFPFFYIENWDAFLFLAVFSSKKGVLFGVPYSSKGVPS